MTTMTTGSVATPNHVIADDSLIFARHIPTDFWHGYFQGVTWGEYSKGSIQPVCRGIGLTHLAEESLWAALRQVGRSSIHWMVAEEIKTNVSMSSISSKQWWLSSVFSSPTYPIYKFVGEKYLKFLGGSYLSYKGISVKDIINSYPVYSSLFTKAEGGKVIVPSLDDFELHEVNPRNVIEGKPSHFVFDWRRSKVTRDCQRSYDRWKAMNP